SAKAGEAEMRLQTMEGKTVTLADFRGKVVIIDIWDTWCPPCRMEIPHFIDLYKTYKGKGLEIIGAAIGREGKDAVVKFIKDNGVNYTNVQATEELLRTYGPIQGIPTTLVLDKKGNVYKKYVGYQDRSVFENDILTLLKK
nr:TlpA disulfide reductase family protein [bacterium]